MGKARYLVGAIVAGLLGATVAVLVAFLAVANNEWFGADDVRAFAFWSVPFVVLLSVVALLARGWLQRSPGPRRFVLAALLGIFSGVVWTLAVALVMGPWVGAFSFPILYLWIFGGVSSLLGWTAFIGVPSPGTAPHTAAPAGGMGRAILMVLGVPAGAVAAAFGIYLTTLFGDIYIWDRGEPELHLIPAGYEGPVVIIFDDPDGAPPEYEGESRLYEIPANGVLRTRFTRSDGWIRPIYMYVDQQGERTPIENEGPCDDLPGDVVQICPMPQRFDFDADGQRVRTDYRAYIVGRRANSRELGMRGDSLVSTLLFGGN